MNIVYDRFLEGVINGSINILKDSFKIALVDDVYEPSASDDSFLDLQIKGYEVEEGPEYYPNGYEKGGKEFFFEKSSEDSLRIYFTSKLGKITWTQATFTARAAVIYKDDPGKTLVTYYDFLENKVIKKGNFSLTWANSYVLSVAAGSIPPEPVPIPELEEELSKTSENALKNRSITNTIGGVGVLMGKYREDGSDIDVEKVPETASTIAYDLDIIADIPASKIDAMFNEE